VKVLFLTHRVPYPPNKGDKIRSFHILKYLTERYQVHLAFPVDNEDDRSNAFQLKNLVPDLTFRYLSPINRELSIFKNLFTNKPLSVGNFWSTRLSKDIQQLNSSEKFDALFVFSSTMAEYAKYLEIPIRIIDFCDLDSAKFEQFAEFSRVPKAWIYRIESERLSRYEKNACVDFDYILFIGPEEKKLFDANGQEDKIKILSNGIDLDRYKDHVEKKARKNSQSPNIAFTGQMDYLPNIDAALWLAIEIFPELRRRYSKLRFYIIGKDPVKKIRKLHDPQKGIYVTGFVQDVLPYLMDSSVFVAPMRIARGMQTKILEAMACFVPVVSSASAASGIDAIADKHLFTADAVEEYVEKISLLLSEPDVGQFLCNNAYDFLSSRFDWKTNLRVLDSLLTNPRGIC
jgi:sugar transferase (PEP-CTERM/EpsH1 system associated)